MSPQGVMACLLCKTETAKTVSVRDRHGNALETCVCGGCGLVFNRPIPNDIELARFYSEDYRKQYKGSFRPRGRQIIRNFRRAREHLTRFSDMFENAQTVLDVGAGSGEFVFAMGQMGKDAKGIEPNKEYAAYCRSDLNVDVATLETLKAEFDEKSFDFINLSHVMEHLNDPVRYLTLLSSWLKDDGVIYVEVPNIFSYTKLKSKGNMFHYGHIFNFSPWTLRAAGGLVGLKECDRSAQRSADSTGVFFEKAGSVADVQTALNGVNAADVLKVIEAHNQNGASVAKKSKFIHKNIVRMEETLASKKLGSPAKIGASVLSGIKGA